MTKPLVKPIRPEFSSGPCAKRPDWSLQALTKATVARSHRHKAAKQKLEKIIELTKSILEIPDNYFVGIVPGSDTGAIEMAMWNILGPRPINILVWDSFGLDWANDIQSQLKLKDVTISKVDYGLLPDFSKENFQGDIVFNWNGTTAGVCIPNADWINPNRDGITICDATSAAFAMNLDWSKLDVATFSWQKCLGGEAGHGMLIVSPKAVKRINQYNPDWPIPKLFQLKKNNMFNQEIFSGSTINTPSMICVEDFLDTLNWAKNIGGLSELTCRSENNLNIIKLLEEEKVAFDIGSYRSAPPGLRIWGGPTVESKDIELLLPWLDWAYAETLKKLNIK